MQTNPSSAQDCKETEDIISSISLSQESVWTDFHFSVRRKGGERIHLPWMLPVTPATLGKFMTWPSTVHGRHYQLTLKYYLFSCILYHNALQCSKYLSLLLRLLNWSSHLLATSSAIKKDPTSIIKMTILFCWTPLRIPFPLKSGMHAFFRGKGDLYLRWDRQATSEM